MKTGLKNPGGLNPNNGFPTFFVDVSEKLGRYIHYPEAVAGISKQFSQNEYSRVLDICCGPGHFCKALNDGGYKVQGIDLSSDQIFKAKSLYPDLPFHIGDMAALNCPVMDMLTNIYTSFGYLSTPEEDFHLLEHWNSKLRQGGGLVMELADMERARNRLPKSGKLKRHTNNIVEDIYLDWETNLLEVIYRKPDGKCWSCLTRLYERDELVHAICKAGFKDIDCYGSFDGKSKEPDDNLIIYAVKK